MFDDVLPTHFKRYILHVYTGEKIPLITWFTCILYFIIIINSSQTFISPNPFSYAHIVLYTQKLFLSPLPPITPIPYDFSSSHMHIYYELVHKKFKIVKLLKTLVSFQRKVGDKENFIPIKSKRLPLNNQL